VLLVLEDLHWADEGSLAMLHHLARRAPGLPLLMVGTYRDLPPDWQPPLEQTLAALNRERLSERLPLRRLPEARVAELVSRLLAEPFEQEDEPERRVPAAFVTALYQETEGNPFFLEEVLQHLVEEGAILRTDGRWQMAIPAEFRVPPSVQAAIGRRLELLSAESREALRLAAVIGLQFDFEVLLEASGVEEERLVGWVEEWLGARLVVEERGGREEVYQSQHALIRAVLYGGVSRRRQGHLHERVGWALETVCVQDREEPLEELAHHFARARSRAAREKGVEYCLRAGEKARHLNADTEAIQHLQGTLRLLDGLPEDEAHWKLRRQAAIGLERSHRARLEWELARQALEQYLARAERAGYSWGMAYAHQALAWHFLWEIGRPEGGEIELARRHAATSLSLCKREGLADLLPMARYHLADWLRREPGSDFPRAEKLLRQALDSRAGLTPAQVESTYTLLAQVYASQGKWDETMAAVRESLAAGGVCVLGMSSFDRLRSGLAGLNLLEEALDAQGRQAEFIAFCDETRRLLAQTGAADPLAQ
jgi:predicted ATPase